MKADLTRDTFHPLKHFSRVLMQQGRVQIDADWNELNAILLHYVRTLAVDLIGEHGGPAENAGFGLEAFDPPRGDFRITAGRYYVDGILCELDTAALPATVQSATAQALVVQVPSFTLDAMAFEAEQYVEMFDTTPSSTFKAAVLKIASVDATHRLLTLQGLHADAQPPETPALRRVVSYLTQPDFPVSATGKLDQGQYQAYLDVWERHICSAEDGSIREVALGGPDTASRARVVWQVKLTSPCFNQAGNGCCDPQDLQRRLEPPSRPRLKARAKVDAAATDPCIVAPDARYRGPENQLYRVEIHTGGAIGDAVPPTFKWSRENGSVVFPIVRSVGTKVLVLQTLGRDDRFGLREGDWVEVEDDDSVLQNLARPLLQVIAIDHTSMSVTLSDAADGVGDDPAKHPLLRRWDQQQGDPTDNGADLGADGAAVIVEDGEDNWLSLEDGVQIQFQPAADNFPPNQYRTGDYWLIPARTATGDVEWPSETDAQGNGVPLALPPDGVVHHYAPLGVLTVDANGDVAETSLCTKRFDPRAKLPTK